MAEAEGRLEWAAQLLGATAVLLEASGKNFDATEPIVIGRIPIINQLDYERYVAGLRGVLEKQLSWPPVERRVIIVDRVGGA